MPLLRRRIHPERPGVGIVTFSRSPDAPRVIWRFSDGRPGHDNQSLGLTDALQRRMPVALHEIPVLPGQSAWLDWLSGRFPPGRLLPDPWLTLTDSLNVGDVVEGTVTNVVDFGAFVALDDGIEGLVHISEFPRAEQRGAGAVRLRGVARPAGAAAHGGELSAASATTLRRSARRRSRRGPGVRAA